MDSWAGNHQIGICNLPKIPPETLELLGGKTHPAFRGFQEKAPNFSRCFLGGKNPRKNGIFPFFALPVFPFPKMPGGSGQPGSQTIRKGHRGVDSTGETTYKKVNSRFPPPFPKEFCPGSLWERERIPWK